jgi:multidrug efflux pump subunit AcrA (membrane-fusion protein)
MEVEVGQIVGVLENPDLEARGHIAASDLERLLLEAAEARLDHDIVAARTHTDEAAEAESRVRLVERKLGELSLTAPIAGVVTTPDRVLDSSPGRFLAQGETFCTIDRIDTVRLAVSTLESDIGEIHEGAEVRLLATAIPGRTLRANVLALSPVAVPPSPEESDALDLVQRVNLIRVLVEVDNPDRRLLPGMSGRVQFLARSRSPAGKVWWRFRRWAGTVIW